MPEFLCFQLQGLMAAWGEIAVGEDRRTAPWPQRSAIVGLAAAALGIRRTEEDALAEIDSSIRVAVVVDESGSLLRDYHTVQWPSRVIQKNWRLATRRDEIKAVELDKKFRKASATIVTKRDYRVGGRWLVALSSQQTGWLKKLEAAFERPRFTLFLGRKACPMAAPLGARIYDCATVEDALARWEDRFAAEGGAMPEYGFGRVEPRARDWYLDENMPTSFEKLDSLKRNDRVVSRNRRQFAPRTVVHARERGA